MTRSSTAKPLTSSKAPAKTSATIANSPAKLTAPRTKPPAKAAPKAAKRRYQNIDRSIRAKNASVNSL